MKTIGLGLALALLAAGPGFAEDVVGTTVVDGRKVQLLDDFTWRYAGDEEAARDCATISRGLAFCAEGSNWARQNNDNQEIAAVYKLDDRTFGVFIVEAIGSDDGVTLDFMSKAVVRNAASGGGVDVEDVARFDNEPATVASLDVDTVLYSVPIEGLDFAYMNTIVILKDRTFQLMTYTINREPTERHRRVHTEFLELVSIGD